MGFPNIIDDGFDSLGEFVGKFSSSWSLGRVTPGAKLEISEVLFDGFAYVPVDGGELFCGVIIVVRVPV